ncbi:MAG: GntR family transcriptional regulator [Acidimicrobiia bacterium]
MAGAEAGGVTEQAYLALREMLTSDGVGPGDHIAEIATAEKLEMSRTPVRAALQRLEQEQLVVKGTNSGYVVAGLVDRDVIEACDVLRLVDTELFIRASDNMTPAEAERVVGLADRMLVAATEGDIETWSAADTEFHQTLAGLADQHLLADIAIKQRRRLHRYWRPAADRLERLVGCAEEHAAVAEAIVGKDHQEVRKIVNEHIGHMEASLLRTLELARPFLAASPAGVRNVG